MNELKKYSWWPLFFTNFFSVFNDNLIKWLVIFVGVTWMPKQESLVIAIASACLVIPFILFSPSAGRFSKIYQKRKIMVVGKAAEIPIMLVAIAGFYFQNIYIVMVAVLLMGTQSSLFSPAKYGLIRDIKGVEGIPFGTGAMEMLTFAGVLLGTVLAGIMADNFVLTILAFVLLFVALIGFITAKQIKANESKVLEQTTNHWFFPVFIYKQFRIANLHPGVNYAVFGLSMFWHIGAMIQMNLAIHGSNVLQVSKSEVGYLMAIAAIGIASGAILTGYLSGKKVHLGYVVIGSIGLSLMVFAITFFNPSYYIFAVMIFLTAFFAGFYKVPLNAYLQSKVKGRKLGDILAYENIMEFTFILLASLAFGIITKVTGDNSIWVFIFIAVASLFVGVFYLIFVPGVKQDFLNILKGKLDREIEPKE